jgi:hypothetical protein
MYLINLKYTKEVAAYNPLAADDVATHDRLRHFIDERESTPSALVIVVTERSPTNGRSAKEGARQEGGGFEGVYLLDLSLLETSKSCSYPFKNQETTTTVNKKTKQAIKYEWVTAGGDATSTQGLASIIQVAPCRRTGNV